MPVFKRVTIDGPIVIYYEQFGDCGDAVFFVHGGGMDSSSWKFQINDFVNANFSVYIYDVRGFGKSIKHEFHDDEKQALDFYSYKNDVSDIISLMDNLGIDKGHFVGHSMGGVIVQALCVYNPDRVLSVTIANSISFSNVCLSHISQTLEQVKMKNNLCHYYKIKVGMTSETEELLKRVKEIKKPVLIIGGIKDLKSPPMCQEYTKKLLPHANLVLLSNIGHLSFTENAKLFNSVVIDFLKTVYR